MRAICVEHNKLRCDTCTEIDRLEEELETTKRLLEEAVGVIKSIRRVRHDDKTQTRYIVSLKSWESAVCKMTYDFLNKLKNEGVEYI